MVKVLADSYSLIQVSTRELELLDSLHFILSLIYSLSLYSRMAYTDESVRAKLSALNETQESIVTVAQWIMFHRYGACDASFLFQARD